MELLKLTFVTFAAEYALPNRKMSIEVLMDDKRQAVLEKRIFDRQQKTFYIAPSKFFGYQGSNTTRSQSVKTKVFSTKMQLSIDF